MLRAARSSRAVVGARGLPCALQRSTSDRRHRPPARRHFSDLFDQRLTWEFLPWLKQASKLPVLLKVGLPQHQEPGTGFVLIPVPGRRPAFVGTRSPAGRLPQAATLRPLLNCPGTGSSSNRHFICLQPNSTPQGVLSPDDARKAVELGADGVIISNHGGRQLNYSPAAVDMLPAIAGAGRQYMVCKCWVQQHEVEKAGWLWSGGPWQSISLLPCWVASEFLIGLRCPLHLCSSAAHPLVSASQLAPACRGGAGRSAAAGGWRHHTRHRCAVVLRCCDRGGV